MKRKPFILEIRDLWPEAIVSVGLLEPGALVTRILERIELFLYRKADCVIPVTEGARDDMIRRGIDPEKIHTVRNGANLSHFSPGPRDNTVRIRFGLADKFVVAYVGTHGMAHALECALEAADRLRNREDIHFLFVGEGAEKPKLIALAEDRRLPNITFVDHQPKAMMPLFLCAADTCLVPLRKHKLFEGTVPSKIFEAMASGRPILLGVQGEAEEIVTDAKAGIPVEPENPVALAKAILRLADDPALGRELGESGVEYVHAHFDRTVLARKMMDILLKYAGEDAEGAFT
jgi:glycosyltransferase involved in cell wall biosynthesis